MALPGGDLTFIGGCYGTDARHIAATCSACVSRP